MSQLHSVAITGMGAICGNGHNLQQVWSSLIAGQSGISLIENFDSQNLAVKIAGEVKNFTPQEEVLNARELDRFDRFNHFGVHAGFEAWKHSGLDKDSPYPAERVGSIMGVGMGGFPEILRTHDHYKSRGPRGVSPFFIPSVIPNMPPGLLSIKLAIKGVNYSISSACASAAHAISAAATEIMLGRQDVMISGGTECVMTDIPFQGFISMKALSKRNDTPTQASRPFDKDRDGFVMGEGAGVLVLENLQKARERGATIYAEICGHGMSSDAHHITAPHPQGEGAGRCMIQCLESANVSAEQIGYVNAHGTSTPLGDIAETQAIKNTFGKHAYKLNVSSTKSMTGHLLGAAGGLETIICAMALFHGIIPPTINLNSPDEQCDLNYTANQAQKREIEYALNNSFGFGGTNSSLLLKKHI